MATALRRTIEKRAVGVWYAPTIIKVGDKFREQIEDGIDQASMFIALITDHYVKSGFCVGELMRFMRRMNSNGKNDLLLLPVLDGLAPENKRNNLLHPVFDEFHYLDLSRRFVDQITVLLGRIDLQIWKQQKGKHPKARHASA